MITSARELLEAAAHVALIARTKSALARTENGMAVNVFEVHACSWCALGLLEAAAMEAPNPIRQDIRRQAIVALMVLHEHIPSWNDSSTDEQVYIGLMHAADSLS
jgi:hypothetical protein